MPLGEEALSVALAKMKTRKTWSYWQLRIASLAWLPCMPLFFWLKLNFLWIKKKNRSFELHGY
jgi:hypothetical protein